LPLGHYRTPEGFACAKQIASYVGLVPSEESSGDRRRLGHISKQGNVLLRFLLVEAAQVTVRSDPQWRSQYATGSSVPTCPHNIGTREFSTGIQISDILTTFTEWLNLRNVTSGYFPRCHPAFAGENSALAIPPIFISRIQA
jgi:Transposase IS116/IS110/IS902 family